MSTAETGVGKISCGDALLVETNGSTLMYKVVEYVLYPILT